MNVLLWLAALVLGAAPRRVWHRLEPPVPLSRAAAAAGILTLAVGSAVGVRGFFEFSGLLAGSNNDWMLRRLAAPAQTGDAAVGLVPYGVSIATFFLYLFTPTGLFSMYLVASGTLRAVAAYTDPDDARGDFVLSAVHAVWTRSRATRREAKARAARERLEGAERPDVLQTGAWAGVDADYVVLASRRKPDWTAGATIMTSTDWYTLGVPFDIETPVGLRTAYPLTKFDTLEALRRGIPYELPPLRGKPQ